MRAALGRENHFFVNNTCVSSTTSPLGLDGTIKGFKCAIDFADPDNAKRVAHAAGNAWYTTGAKWELQCGNDRFSISDFQKQNRSLNASVSNVAALSADTLKELVERKMSLL